MNGHIAVHSYIYILSTCTGEIRLANGSVPSEGRVEVFYEGLWRRVVVVSNDTAAVAHIACRQAGYLYMEGTQSFGQGSGPVWRILTCTGSEERLEQCVHLG